MKKHWIWIVVFVLLIGGIVSPTAPANGQTIVPPEEIGENQVCGAVTLINYEDGETTVAIQVPAENEHGHAGWTYTIERINGLGVTQEFVWGPELYVEPARIMHTWEITQGGIYRVKVHPPSSTSDGKRDITCFVFTVGAKRGSDFSQLLLPNGSQTSKSFMPIAAR